jgi:exosortase/archaeosortase family protein
MLIFSKINRQNENTYVLNFFSKFLLFIVLFQVSVYFIHSIPFLSQSIQLAITHSVAFVYQLIAEPIIIDGNTLLHKGVSRFLIVDNECTGLMLLASVSAVIMALNQSFSAKIKMLMVATLILQVENILRITHLMYEIKKEGNFFDIYHLYIWQAVNFVTALLVILGVERLFGNKEA